VTGVLKLSASNLPYSDAVLLRLLLNWHSTHNLALLAGKKPWMPQSVPMVPIWMLSEQQCALAGD